MIQIVATPGSGDGCAQATAERIERALAARGQPARLELFHGLRRLSRWSASCRAGFSHLICVGGDATMSASATAAIRHRVPLLPVPSGFGNLFARTFGHTDDVPAVLRTLDAARVVWVDAGARHGEIFLSHESFGMLDEIQDEVEHGRGQPRSRVLRLLAYYRMGLRFLGRALPSSIRVEVDGALVARRAALVTIANVQAYGAFLTLTPDASPTDGLLDVFVIPRTTKLRVWGRLLKVLLHVPPRGDEVLIRRGRRVSVGMPGRPNGRDPRDARRAARPGGSRLARAVRADSRAGGRTRACGGHVLAIRPPRAERRSASPGRASRRASRCPPRSIPPDGHAALG